MGTRLRNFRFALVVANLLIPLGFPAWGAIYSYTGPDGVVVFTNDPMSAPAGAEIALRLADPDPKAGRGAPEVGLRLEEPPALAERGTAGKPALRGEKALREALAIEQAGLARREVAQGGAAAELLGRLLGGADAGALLGGFGGAAPRAGRTPAPKEARAGVSWRALGEAAAAVLAGAMMISLAGRHVRSGALRAMTRGLATALILAALYETFGRWLLARAHGGGAAEIARLLAWN